MCVAGGNSDVGMLYKQPTESESVRGGKLEQMTLVTLHKKHDLQMWEDMALRFAHCNGCDQMASHAAD